jgi:hypothetical protein
MDDNGDCNCPKNMELIGRTCGCKNGWTGDNCDQLIGKNRDDVTGKCKPGLTDKWTEGNKDCCVKYCKTCTDTKCSDCDAQTEVTGLAAPDGTTGFTTICEYDPNATYSNSQWRCNVGYEVDEEKKQPVRPIHCKKILCDVSCDECYGDGPGECRTCNTPSLLYDRWCKKLEKYSDVDATTNGTYCIVPRD